MGKESTSGPGLPQGRAAAILAFVREARRIPLLLAGMLTLDLLLNAPAFDAASPGASLLQPSLDLMLLLGALVLVAQAPPKAREWLRIALVLPALVMMGFAAAAWSGPVAVFLRAHLALAVAILAAAGAAAWLAFALVLRGLTVPILRNVLLLAVSFLAILQITMRLPVFRQSVIPRLIGEVQRLLRTG
jgi:hypothetical protein